MKNRLTLLTCSAVLAMASLQANASFAPTEESSDWDLGGIFDDALGAVGINMPSRGVAQTPVAAPTPNVTPYEERFTKPQTATGGVPVCQNRNAVSQQSASQYQVQPVSRAY